jgi:hypothetical protein
MPMRVAGAGPHAAIYRARYDPGPGERARKFRLLVYAAEPDRLHGEILSAVGTTEVILDAGEGRVSVFFVRDRVAFVGRADERALDALLGVPVRVQDLVRALLGDLPAASGLDWTVAPAGIVYPDSILLRAREQTFELSLKRVRPMRGDRAELGTGRPPAGADQRPLSDLEPEEIPGIEVEEGGESP